jgi:hypothetical protein
LYSWIAKDSYSHSLEVAVEQFLHWETMLSASPVRSRVAGGSSNKADTGPLVGATPEADSAGASAVYRSVATALDTDSALVENSIAGQSAGEQTAAEWSPRRGCWALAGCTWD